MPQAEGLPGEILKKLWIDELGYTQSSFADALVEASHYKVKKSGLLISHDHAV